MSEDTKRNPVTPNETSKQEDEGGNLTIEEQNLTTEDTVVEITTENPITQTLSTTNEHENVIKAGTNGEETTGFYLHPQ